MSEFYKIAMKNYNNDETVITAYGVALTETLNSFSTVAFNFNALGDNKVAEDLLGPRTLFTLENGQTFRLTTSNPTPNSRYRQYAITATHVGHDLNDYYIKDTINGQQSMQACLDFLTKNTPFKYQLDSQFDNHDFGDSSIGDGHGDDVLSAIAEAFACEWWFDNYTLHIAKKIGKDDAFVFVDRVNTSHISWNEDYSDFRTAIHGTGKPIEQNNDSGGGSGGDLEAFARSFVGKVPYVWGGCTPSGWDCSGFVSYLLNHFGVNVGPHMTLGLSQLGPMVGPPYQTGDLLFWGPQGAWHHTSIAVSNGYRVGADNYTDGTVYRPIDSWPPTFGVRVPAIAALVKGGNNSSTDDNGDDSGDSNTDAADQPEQYTCEADYFSPWADKPGIGKIWADDFSSDTITDEKALKEAMKAQLHDYPDVEYTVDWISFKQNASGMVNEVKVGDNGWLRDRLGTDVNVRIQSYTRYLDSADASSNDSITFGNKIFDSTLYDTRQNQANDTRQQLERLQEQVNNNSNIGFTIPTMNGEEVQRLDSFFKQ